MRLLDDLLDPETEVPNGDINAVDHNGNTPLADACENGRLDAIKLIFEKCWDPRGKLTYELKRIHPSKEGFGLKLGINGLHVVSSPV